jgi:cardiolipin synthase (CMP-forming)
MPRTGEARIATVPNALSLARLGGLGLFCYLLFGANEPIAAAVVLGVTGATDFVDGVVARRFDQVTSLGKVLDPTADRIVVITGMCSILAYGAVPLWLGLLVICREVLVSGAVLLLAVLGARRIDVLWVGKAGTFGLMGCFPLFLGSYGGATWQHVLRDVTWVLIVPALVFSLYAAASYVPLARSALREGRRGGDGRAGGGPPGAGPTEATAGVAT